MPVQHGLYPRETVPDSDRTDGKDDAFEALEELREDDRLYGRAMTDLEDEIGWSRQHIANVIRDYYTSTPDAASGGERAEGEGEGGGGVGGRIRFDLEIPDDISDREAFLRGYVQGYLAADRE